MIEIKGLNHYYGRFHALSDVTFSMPAGSITGLIGQNGAGKSTLLKILTGFLVPARGQILVNGVEFFQDPISIRKQIGYMPETPLLYKDMVVEDYLIYVGHLKGLSKEHRFNQREKMIEKCGLVKMRKKLIGDLSKGNRQRVALAQALIGNPKILLLDEPTSALDPKQVIEIRNLIYNLKEEGAIVLMSSHILSEISQVCDNIVCIRDGKIQYVGTVSDLAQTSQQKASATKLRIRFLTYDMSWSALFSKIPGGHLKSQNKSEVLFEVDNPETFYPLLIQITAENNLPLREMTIERDDLESLFRN